jgi:hypothetical protein
MDGHGVNAPADVLLGHLAPLGWGRPQLQWRVRLADRTAQGGVPAATQPPLGLP